MMAHYQGGTALNAHRIARRAGIAIMLVVMSTMPTFAAAVDPAAAYYADASRPAAMELAPPPLPASNRTSDGEVGFPKADAGISAYYRIPAPPDGQRLDIMAVVIALTAEPGADDEMRAGAADIINLGLNFGIIEIPMHGAVTASTPPPTEVRVYFDDQGWIIAYLPKDKPAAAIWRYGGNDGGDGNDALDGNFLARAIELVVSESGSETDGYAGPSGYYDWQNPDCDAYVAFSNRIGEQDSVPVRFLIPDRIKQIQASAAVLIIDHSEGGSPDTAELQVDDVAVVSASRDTEQSPHNAINFDLTRAEGLVSEHNMAVIASRDGISAAGVVMLLYDKP